MRMLRVGHVINLIALLLLAGIYLRALAYTPVEQSQGLAQKIFYLHVPAAIWAELAMIVVGLSSVFYLFTKDPRLDRSDMGEADLGHLVDLGCPPDVHALPLSAVCRLSAVARRRDRSRRAGPFR